MRINKGAQRQLARACAGDFSFCDPCCTVADARASAEAALDKRDLPGTIIWVVTPSAPLVFGEGRTEVRVSNRGLLFYDFGDEAAEIAEQYGCEPGDCKPLERHNGIRWAKLPAGVARG